MKELMTYPFRPIPYSTETADDMLLKTEKSKEGFHVLTKDVEQESRTLDALTLIVNERMPHFIA